MRLSPTGQLRAVLPSLTAVALAVSACADPTSPRVDTGALRPSAQVGQDLTNPVQATFGTGMETAAGRDTRILVKSGDTWIQSFVQVPNARWHTPIAGTQWIGPVVNSATNYVVPVQHDEYQTTFFLPLGATDPVLNFQLWSDNAAAVFVNGVHIGEQPQSDDYANYGCLDPDPADDCVSFATTPYLYTTSGDPIPWNFGGMNTVRIVVFNADFKQGCQNVPVVTPDCRSAAGLDFLSTLHFAPPCDFMTFGRLVTATAGGAKVVISGNAGGNAPAGGILGEMEIDVGSTKYHVHVIDSYGAIATGPLSGPDYPNARIITGTALNGSAVELRLFDGGEPGTNADEVYLVIDGGVVVGQKIIDLGNVQYHPTCRGPA